MITLHYISLYYFHKIEKLDDVIKKIIQPKAKDLKNTNSIEQIFKLLVLFYI